MADLAWPRLRKLLRAPSIGFNAEVYRHFKDVHATSTDVGRRAIRDFCLIGAKDSRTTANSKIQYFRDQVQKVHLKPEIYGIPVANYKQETVEGYPQVIIHFRESATDARTNDRYPIRAQVGYRLKDDSLSQSQVDSLATKVKSKFGGATPFKFKKGTTKFSYKDKKKGYEFILAADTETEAKSVVTAVLSLNGDTPDWDILTASKSGRTWTTKKTKTVLGKTVELPNQRPIGWVHFTHAELKIPELERDIVLVDQTGRFKNALLWA